MSLKDYSISDLFFISKSTPIRVNLDALCQSKEHKKLNYSELETQLLNAESTIAKALGSGIDTEYPLVTPYPFIVNVWSGASENKSVWNEGLELKRIFSTYPAFSQVSSIYKIVTPSEEEYSLLMDAVNTLSQISGEILKDFSLNVRFVCIVDTVDAGYTSSTSFSQKMLPGTLFIGRDLIPDKKMLLESLYHETLHSKWVNTYKAFNIYKSEGLLSTSASFDCVWATENQPKIWPFSRAVAAFHVYCHLIVYHSILLKSSLDDQTWSKERLESIYVKFTALQSFIESLNDVFFTSLGLEFISQMSELTRDSYTYV